jgi:hypothetical protein
VSHHLQRVFFGNIHHHIRAQLPCAGQPQVVSGGSGDNDFCSFHFSNQHGEDSYATWARDKYKVTRVNCRSLHNGMNCHREWLPQGSLPKRYIVRQMVTSFRPDRDVVSKRSINHVSGRNSMGTHEWIAGPAAVAMTAMSELI